MASQAAAADLRRVLVATDRFLEYYPETQQPERSHEVETHRWWLREADRHATDGFYDGGECPTLMLLGKVHLEDGETAQAERSLENLLVRKRHLELYEKVRAASLQRSLFSSDRLGLVALFDGTYATIQKQLGRIVRNAQLTDRATFSTDVLLPRSIMRMNYPFSTLRARLPPSPNDLRVLFDWEVSFSDCFDSEFLIDLKYEGGRNGKKIWAVRSNGYVRHVGAARRIDAWILDLAGCNHSLHALATFNGSYGNGHINFTVQQKNMHKKHWLYKVQRVVEHFDGRFPLLHDPRELYNAARRAVRSTHSYCGIWQTSSVRLTRPFRRE